MKSILVNDLFFLLSFMRVNYIQSKDTPELKNSYELFKYDENLSPENQTLLKEIYFIKGIRTIKAKPLIDYKIDKKLINFYNLSDEELSKYFISHFYYLKHK